MELSFELMNQAVLVPKSLLKSIGALSVPVLLDIGLHVGVCIVLLLLVRFLPIFGFSLTLCLEACSVEPVSTGPPSADVGVRLQELPYLLVLACCETLVRRFHDSAAPIFPAPLHDTHGRLGAPHY